MSSRPRSAATALLLAVLTVLLAACSATVGGTGAPATAAGSTATRLSPVNGGDVLFFGDSWTSGYGADEPDTQGFVALTSKAFGWKAETVAVGGGGYLQRGGKGQTFLERLRNIAPTLDPPRLIVLQGGLNDHRNPDAAGIHSAYLDLVGFMRTQWPGAQIATLGPISPLPTSTDGVLMVDAAVAGAAAQAGVPYIDAQRQGWFPADPPSKGLINTSKGGHPSTAGYQLLGTRLVAALRQLGA